MRLVSWKMFLLVLFLIDIYSLTAILARKLNCPVLSYDSDFYIFDGLYVPFVTITPKVYKKTVSTGSTQVEIIAKGQRNAKKKSKKIVIANEESVEGTETYNYLDCCLYQIENLTGGKLDNEMLPLFAILLGNDFISRRWFNKFFSKVSKRKSTKKHKKKGMSPQQKKIFILMSWLQHESLRSAIRKILECVELNRRPLLWSQIRNAMRGYSMVRCKSFEYFGFVEEKFERDDEGILAFTLDEIMAEEEEEVSEEEEEAEEEENESDTEVIEENDEEEEIVFATVNEDDYDPEHDQLTDEEAEETQIRPAKPRQKFPDWFKKIYNAGLTPRFLVDIFCCCRYINYPSIEDFHGPDGNIISHSFLFYLYGMLHSTDENMRSLYYYTRVKNQVRYEVKKIEPEKLPEIGSFDSEEQKSEKHLKLIFGKTFENVNELFEKVKILPEAYQLYVLMLIYWLKNSTKANQFHLQAAIVGLIALNVIDKKCEKFHRESTKFNKNNEKLLKSYKENLQLVDQPDDSSVSKLMKSVTKQEALLTMENLVGYYEISAKFQRKHADFRREVVIAFCEFQYLLFNVHAMIPFLNYPFENIKMENCFNGLFLYNMYLSLKSRSSSLEYLNTHLFRLSPTMMKIFMKIHNLCLEFLPNIGETSSIEIKPVNTNRRKAKKPASKIAKNQINDDCTEPQNESDNEFEDLNNQFAQLLKM